MSAEYRCPTCLMERSGFSHTAALADMLPRGNATVIATKGGHNVHNPETNDTAVIATAAVEAFLPDQSSAWKQSKT